MLDCFTFSHKFTVRIIWKYLINHGTGRRLERFVDHQSVEKCISLIELSIERFTPMQAPVAHDGTGQIKPRSDREFAASTGNIPWNKGGCSPLWTVVQATCVTVEHVGWSSRGGGEGAVLGQETERRGQGDLAI